jgi:hypothetical protein
VLVVESGSEDRADSEGGWPLPGQAQDYAKLNRARHIRVINACRLVASG